MCLDHGGSIYCQLTDNITLFTHKHLFTWYPFMILASLVFDMDFTVNLVHECGSPVSKSYSTFHHSWWEAGHGPGSKATQLSTTHDGKLGMGLEARPLNFPPLMMESWAWVRKQGHSTFRHSRWKAGHRSGSKATQLPSTHDGKLGMGLETKPYLTCGARPALKWRPDCIHVYWTRQTYRIDKITVWVVSCGACSGLSLYLVQMGYG